MTQASSSAEVRPQIPLRSVLFAPGNEARKVRKLTTFGADCVVLDLEDAVPDVEKVETRAKVRTAVSAMSGALVTVRVNSMETGLTQGDIDAVVSPGLDAILIPKVIHSDNVERVDEFISKAEAREGLLEGRIRLIPIVETCLGILRGDGIAAAKSQRVITLAFGSGDLTLDLDLPTIRRDNAGDELAFARAKLVYDTRSAGLPRPLDGPYLAVHDLAGFEEDCLVACKLGYQGKICVYPPQVTIANKVFTPDPNEVAFCRKVINEFTAALEKGSASITVDGVFVDYPILTKAKRIVALAEELAARDAGVQEMTHGAGGAN